MNFRQEAVDKALHIFHDVENLELKCLIFLVCNLVVAFAPIQYMAVVPLISVLTIDFSGFLLIHPHTEICLMSGS